MHLSVTDKCSTLVSNTNAISWVRYDEICAKKTGFILSHRVYRIAILCFYERFGKNVFNFDLTSTLSHAFGSQRERREGDYSLTAELIFSALFSFGFCFVLLFAAAAAPPPPAFMFYSSPVL